MTIGHLIQSTYSTLLCAGLGRLDVELILNHVLCCDRVYLYTHWNQTLDKRQMKYFQSLCRRRKKGVPMAYIMEKKEFYGYEFIVKPGVFIPRPETETIVSAVLSQWNNQEKLTIVDFGSGSGCIGLTLLALFPKASLISVDSNQEAVKVSKMNARNMGLEKRTIFLNTPVSDLGKEDEKRLKGQVDVVVANPPYISFDDERVSEEVAGFEPPEALFSDEGGLYHIRSWLNSAAQLLKPGGAYFFEIGAKQDISSIEYGVDKMRRKREHRDLSGIIRVIQFQKCYG